jgi:uncharacterized protein VirK/YbjX
MNSKSDDGVVAPLWGAEVRACQNLMSKPKSSSEAIRSYFGAAARLVFPRPTLPHTIRRALFPLKARFYAKPWQHLLDRGFGEFARTLRARPELLGVIEWPYIHSAWGASRRIQAICAHYELIEAQAWLHVPIASRLRLVELDDVQPGLSLQLERPQWFIREGELTLSLFLDTTRLYSVCFTFDRRDGEVVAYVGGIQGRNIEAAKEQYADLTKQLHGARPRDFLLVAAGLVCAQVGVKHILGVCDANRHHRHPYFQGHLDGDRVSSVYDDIWSDRGGQVTADGFMTMHVPFENRSLEEVSSKKRAMYRRRYELFEQVSQAISAVAAQGQVSSSGLSGSSLALISGPTL